MKKNGKKTYGIVGLGRFGYALATELASSGVDIIVIDMDEEKIREIRDYTENAYIVKSFDKKSLEETGIQNCDIAIVCIGEHLDTSILTTLHLVSLGIPRVISKANSLEHGQILEKIGAEVVYPEQDIAIRLAHRLETSLILDYIQLSEKLNITKFIVPENLVGYTVLEANLRGRFGANIITVENDKQITQTVSPDYVFQKGDIIFVAGNRKDLNRLTSWAESNG